MQEFMLGLDEYFCEKYANYDMLCGLEGYKMPKMQTTEIRDGRSFAYTLPPETMRLALQENKAELLKAVKKNLVDKTFSFSFYPLKWRERISNRLGVYGFVKVFKNVLLKNGKSVYEIENDLTVDSAIFKKIKKGAFLPTKNLIFSIALAGRFTKAETTRLLEACGAEWEFTHAKDTVVCYLLEKSVFSPTLIKKAFDEYKIENLFLRLEEAENGENS